MQAHDFTLHDFMSSFQFSFQLMQIKYNTEKEWSDVPTVPQTLQECNTPL